MSAMFALTVLTLSEAAAVPEPSKARETPPSMEAGALRDAGGRRGVLHGQKVEQRWDTGTATRLAAALATPDGPSASPDDLKFLIDDVSRPVGIIVSGGVSLGAYEAGFLYYYTQFLLAQQDFARGLGDRLGAIPALDSSPVNLTTGASAGSINSFLAAVESCRLRRPRPEDSLFYQAWIPVGIDDLMANDDLAPGALLSMKPIKDASDKIVAAWASDQGWGPVACRAKVGVSVTRVLARPINILAEGTLNVPKQGEKFIIAMDGAPARPPKLSAFDPAGGGGQTVLRRLYPLVFTGSDELSIEGVTNVLRASAAFPVAFSPVPLGYRIFEKAIRNETRFFIDGGVFDNTPIRLAARIHRWSYPDQAVSRQRLQFEMGAGWSALWKGRLSTFDRYMWRHGPEVLLGAALFQRIFLDISATQFLDAGECRGRNDCSRISADHRQHEVPLVSSNWQVRGTFGLRLLFE